MQVQSVNITDVERWNDEFARENDSNEYYAQAGLLIRWIEGRRLRFIREMVAAGPEDRILEVGCGAGHVLQMFPDAALTAVDVSGKMLRKACKNLAGYHVEFFKGELHELDLPAHSFTKIICTEVLEHVVDPASVLEQMRRLLHPDGRAVVTFPNDRLVHGLKGVVRRTGLKALPLFRRVSWGGDKYHLHVWRIREMQGLLAECFTVCETRFAPYRWLPIRCCFQCAATKS